MNIHLTKKNQVSSPMKLLVLRQNVLIQTLWIETFGLKSYRINTKRDFFFGFDLRLQKYFNIADGWPYLS